MNSKTIIQVGIALILLGIVAFFYPAGSDTSRDKAINIGLLPASVDANRLRALSPLTAGLVLAGGVLLVIVGINKSS